MKKILVSLLVVVVLLTGAAFFVLGTGAGLRWTIDELLTRSGAPVEIGGADGRLLGPVLLTDVRYREPGDGASIRIKQIRLDWQPTALLHGLLHVTVLRAAGLEYAPGKSAGPSGPRKLDVPQIILPFQVRVDRAELDGADIGTGSGTPLRIDSASLSGALDGSSLHLEDVTVALPDYRVDHGDLRIDLRTGLPIESTLDWRVEAMDGRPAFSGGLSVSGTVGDTLKPVLDIREPFAAHGEGTVSDLLNQLHWSVNAAIPVPVSLSAIEHDWPQLSLRGSVRGEGDTGEARLQPDLSLEYQGRKANVQGTTTVSADALVVEQARVSLPAPATDALQFSGRLGFGAALPFKVQGQWSGLQGPEDAAWLSRSGKFEASGDKTNVSAMLSGVILPPDATHESDIKVDVNARHLDTQPVITGTARLPYFAWGGIDAGSLKADVDYRTAGDASSQITVTAATLHFGDHQAHDMKLRATGSTQQHDLSLEGRLDDWTIGADVAGSYSDQRWQGSVQRLSIASQNGTLPGEWDIQQPADIAWSPDRTEIGELCLTHAGAKLCGKGHFAGAGDWSAAAQLDGFPLKWLARAAPASLEFQGAIAADAKVGDQGNGIEGQAHATIGDAAVAWTGEQPVQTRYRGVEFIADLKPARLHMQLHGTVDESGTIQGELSTDDPLGDDGKIEGSIAANLPSLRVVQAAFPDLGLTGGSARLQFKLDGTRSAPRFTGEGRIQQATLEVEPLGIELQSLNLDLRSRDDRSLHVEAQAQSGDGTLNGQGDLAFPQEGGWRGKFSLSGSEAQLARLPRAAITGNPDLHVVMDDTGGQVDGSIQITRADLTPEAGRPQVTLSDDITVVNRNKPQSAATNPMGWHARVTIDLGDHTHFQGYGVDGRLSGSLSLNAPPHQPTRATGGIEIHDGQYSLYGRTFNINKGQLVYAGGPIDNPGIDVQVGRKVRDISVTLAVTGDLVHPQLDLSSTPAMSDTDKMSYLLLGRPASQASGAEAGVLLSAAASLIPGGNSKGVSRKIESTLGLDTVEVESDSADSAGASLVLGKYLSPRLYVSYVAGIQQAVEVFRVRYELAKHWLLRAESSTRESSGDLLFKW